MTGHPSFYLTPEWAATIRQYAPDAEQLGMLHPEQLTLAYKHHWFKLLMPAEYSGAEKSLPEMVRVEESLSWADGSLGWVITLCAGAGWFGGFLNRGLAADILKDNYVCFAGSGAAGGTAGITDTGYLINGSWKYASGAHHASHITANCRIEKDGQPVLDATGEPLILPFVFDKADVEVLPAWKYIGMVATGSDAFAVHNLHVKADRCFKIAPEAVVVDHPLYRYPFLQLAETTLAANLSGMAIHFMDLCDGIFKEKLNSPRLTEPQKELMMADLRNAVGQMNITRQHFYTALDESWQALVTHGVITDELLARVSSISRKLARLTRTSVDQLYPYCGLQAASTDTEINRVWRDLHTAGQHALLTFES